MPDKIKIGMADWKAGRDEDILITFGLGSCVALSLWNSRDRVGAMAHVMLPDSKLIRYRHDVSPAKFGDTALGAMLLELEKMGYRKELFCAKVVGGANMFSFAGKMTGSTMNVGQRNVQAVKESLTAKGIPLLAEDTGGTVGRSVEFYTSDGKMRVRTAMFGEKDL